MMQKNLNNGDNASQYQWDNFPQTPAKDGIKMKQFRNCPRCSANFGIYFLSNKVSRIEKQTNIGSKWKAIFSESFL